MRDHPIERKLNYLQVPSSALIVCNARLAIIDADWSPGGCRNNFEPDAAYVIEVDPVELSQSTKKAASFDATANVSSASIFNQGLLGIDYWWYKHKEYKAIYNAQKEDLGKWRATLDDQAATKKAKEEYYDSIWKPKVYSVKAKKKSAKNKRLKKKKETKKAKADLASLLKDD